MTPLAAVLLVAGALIIGIVAQTLGEVTVGWHWAVVGVAALIGGWLGSEAFGTLSTRGPEYGDLYILPAIIGGVVLGAAIDLIVRYLTRGSYVSHPRAI
ncbi:MAG TPA: GlsB/YeaQ/YmgE family stress response membrane protein [candidate division Zixibacteria bacterium]|nr:GlsB/YeaQ/YmgE family stress response membrane protein [candidate division Zixibacteria bacterium]